MKRLIWKLRFSLAARKLLATSWSLSWEMAEAWLTDVIDEDLTQDPVACAEEERDAWASST